jgi:hypothetical protein
MSGLISGRQFGLSVEECGHLLSLCLCWDHSSSDGVLTFSLLFLYRREPLPLDLLLSTGSTRGTLHLIKCESALPLSSLFSAHLLKAATLPVTIECVTAGGVSPALANVVLPMGANVNMDGAAISFPCAILFLASSDSLVSTMTAFTWINIALCCSLGSVGAAPVPSAGMVTLITIWQTVFPSHDVPEAIAYVQVASFSLLLLPHSLFLLTGYRFLG